MVYEACSQDRQVGKREGRERRRMEKGGEKGEGRKNGGGEREGERKEVIKREGGELVLTLPSNSTSPGTTSPSKNSG